MQRRGRHPRWDARVTHHSVPTRRDPAGCKFREIEHPQAIASPPPAIARAALVRVEDQSHATSAGFTARVGKPTDPPALIDAILVIDSRRGVLRTFGAR